MGANFIWTTLDGDMSQAALRKEFLRMQEEDRYENGHSYSGGWGMCDGLEVDSCKVFACVDDSVTWLGDRAVKWGPAVAVQAKAKGGKRVWVLAGTCSC